MPILILYSTDCFVSEREGTFKQLSLILRANLLFHLQGANMAIKRPLPQSILFTLYTKRELQLYFYYT